MTTYLIGMLYHEPETWALFQQGIVEDCESSTGIFVDAKSTDEAKAWAEIVAEALLRKSNDDDMLDWKGLGYTCWLEENPDNSDWRHCLSFFQTVRVGEWPNLDAMGSSSYSRWTKENGVEYS
ncbi:hypothetical protein [Collimonas humicola]|uniref:hypothetical protein n=1 Tax=Collimonas humicola TaxID=2825886 RepID=UPI001B8C631E|nr:hypothetical protein [Collimonas humicola]